MDRDGGHTRADNLVAGPWVRTGKLEGRNGWTGGREGTDPERYVRAVGRVRAVVIGLDFEDAPASSCSGELRTVSAYADQLVPGAVQWFASSSQGRLQLDVDICPTWFRMSRSHGDYGFSRGISTETHWAYIQEAVSMLGDEVDVSGYDIVYFVVPRNATGVTFSPTWIDHGMHVVGKAGVVRHAVTFGQDMWHWGFKVLNHETGHTFGLPDLYTYEPIGTPPNAHPYVGGWDLMGLISGHAPELLAWHKWRLGWIDDDQVKVLQPGEDALVQLSPIEVPGGTKMVLLPMGPTQAIAAESRRAIGNDGPAQDEGMLVYRVSTAGGVRAAGAPPVRVVRQNGRPAFTPDDLSLACFRPGAPELCHFQTGSEDPFSVGIRVVDAGESGDTVRVVWGA